MTYGFFMVDQPSMVQKYAATFPRARSDPKPTILNPTSSQPGSNLLHLIPCHHPAGGAHPPGHGVAIAADVLGLSNRIRIKICEERQDFTIAPHYSRDLSLII